MDDNFWIWYLKRLQRTKMYTVLLADISLLWFLPLSLYFIFASWEYYFLLGLWASVFPQEANIVSICGNRFMKNWLVGFFTFILLFMKN